MQSDGMGTYFFVVKCDNVYYRKFRDVYVYLTFPSKFYHGSVSVSRNIEGAYKTLNMSVKNVALHMTLTLWIYYL